jgi:hypothetical protein
VSIRILIYQLDKHLEPIFDDQSLDQKVWFSTMEQIVRERLPRRSLVVPYEFVLEYVKWKAKQRNKNV